MHLQRKHLLIASALAVEWILAFAFARRFANAVADAQSAFAWENAEAPSLELRVRDLEAWHGVVAGRAWPRIVKHGRPMTTEVGDGQGGLTRVD